MARGRPKKKEVETKTQSSNKCDCGAEMNIEGDVLRCPKCQAWREYTKHIETKEDKRARLLKELELLDKE